MHAHVVCDPFLAARMYLSVPLHMEDIFYTQPSTLSPRCSALFLADVPAACPLPIDCHALDAVEPSWFMALARRG